jgi:CRISPR-associated endonuclease/helicase Cas3
LQPLEIVDNVPELYQKLKRVNYDLPQAGAKYDNWDLIAAELKQERQVLCVVNTRRDCYDLFKLMPEGTLHLSGLMHAEHRTRVIAEIKNRLKKDFPIAVISTQLVEAGVDIDFPVVYRALAGGDSIVQAAGRCNREGKLEEKGLLKIFRAPSPPPKGLQAKAAVLTEEFIAMDAFMPHDPKFFQSFFQKFYSRVNTIGEEYLRDLIQDTPYIPFRSAADKFHLIDDKSQGTVIVAAGVDSSLIEELKFAGPNRALMRKLQRFVVTLPKWLIEKMAVDGRLRYLDSEKAAGFVIQGCIAYNEQTGLDIYAEQLPVDKLIM